MWISKKVFTTLRRDNIAQDYNIGVLKDQIAGQKQIIGILTDRIESMEKYVKLADILMETNKKVDNDETV